jgi:GDP-L-fucose synthase
MEANLGDFTFWREKSVLVAGAGGLIGAALMRALEGRCARLVGWRRADGDLTDAGEARRAIAAGPYDVVFLMAATQGGVADHLARPLAYVRENAALALNVIGACADSGVRQLVYAASTALYPDQAAGVLTEDLLASGPIEASHQPYAAAKLLGLRLCQACTAERGLCYTPAILTNVYGPGGSFDPQRSTLIHALIARAVAAHAAGEDTLRVWGSGRAVRDVLFGDDAAQALLRVAASQDPRPITIASGENHTVAAIAGLVAAAIGLEGIAFDPAQPEGALGRTLDVSRLRALGFAPLVSLADGIHRTLAAYRNRL